MTPSSKPLALALILVFGCAEPHNGSPQAAPVAAPANGFEAQERERLAASGSMVFDFDQAGAETLPVGWHVAGANQGGSLMTWSVGADPTAPTQPNVLALTSSRHGSGGTFNLCWTDSMQFGDGALELAFKANGGEEDQGGGPIWRVLDEKNYYVCRMNPLESNLRVYYVKDGERHQLASAQVEVARATWHRIRVEHTGEHILCTLDGATKLDVSDDHLPRAGGVGVWTKADAETSFDHMVVQPATRAPLTRTGSIELPGVEGRIDHLAIDLKRERLFVAALGNDSVEVLDLKAGRVERRLPAREPQGILYLADSDRMVVANGKAGTCDVYAGDTLERVASVALGDDADNLRYDARTKRLYVAFGDALGVVDGEAWKLLDKIPLDGHPESFQLDASGKRAFVNVPDARQLVLIGLEDHSVLRKWSIEEAQANFPMAWVPGDATAPDGLLLLGCRSPAKLVVRSAESGESVGALELSGDVDDIFHDAGRRRAYAACGAGFVDVFQADEHNGFRLLERVPTEPGARTCLLVAERGQLFVAIPHRGPQRAEVRIFGVQD